MAEQGQAHEFRAEVLKVLNILTNSLYTNREIFLRELISNASDALDKLRFRTNKGEVPLGADLEQKIDITIDKDKNLLIVSDTGVGMTESELADNLGTIARSGSEHFLADLDKSSSSDKEADASQIIGKFGVGFYSVFMVARKVRVISRYAFPDQGGSSEAHVWTSDGLGTYFLESTTESEPVRGTRIEISFKDNADEFLNDYRIKEIINKHSAFIPFPIFLNGERVNTQPALWREPKSNVKPEQYNAFYKSITFDSEDPLDVQHISVDVPVQFSALLFIPNHAKDVFGVDQHSCGIDLYSRRVLIQAKNNDLLPEYLRFMAGVVDAEDLPLNISRETLQENVLLQKIKQVLVKQTLGKLEKLAKEKPEDYEHFWNLHSRIFQLGYSDYANQDRVVALWRYNSSALGEGEKGKVLLTSLEDYKNRAKSGQKTFWYLYAGSRESALLNPHLEMFRKKGLEVLFLLDHVDEFCVSQLGTYQGWEFKSVETAKAEDVKDFPDLETPEATQENAPLSKEDTDTFDNFMSFIKEILGERVKEVRVTSKLADSPAVLVSPEGLTNSWERIMKVMRKDDSLPVRDLEVNRDHNLLRSMFKIFKADKNDPILKEMIEDLFDYCMMLEGYIREPQLLASNAQAWLTKSAAWYTSVRNLG
ncbi:MAG: molecular chaperone HtpG [Desulfovibrionaceae bacterium]|nr:molecular chaperone HtpG [Desulfovibrionaceae bacterium]